MKLHPSALPALACALALTASVAASSASADDESVTALPGIGEIAPAFALHPFQAGAAAREGAEGASAVELDSVCGIRNPESTAAVLVIFVDEGGMDDLSVAHGWHRKYHKDGLQILALSEVRRPESFRASVVKARFGFTVLDDRHGVVATRYGVPGAPFSLLLDRECRVLGMNNRALGVEQEGLGAAISDLVSKAKAERKARRRRK